MKLISVYIEKYKNLIGTYDFTDQDGYAALIGENGSGKSNLLEAIGLIFQSIFNKINAKAVPKNTIAYLKYNIFAQYGQLIGDCARSAAPAPPHIRASPCGAMPRPPRHQARAAYVV